MKHHKNGASQTEYILIVVLVAITVMFAVGQYGKEVKALFKKSTAKLDFKDTSDSVQLSNEYNGNNNNQSGISEDTDDAGDIISDNEDDFIEENNNEEECNKRYEQLVEEKNRLISNYNSERQDMKNQAYQLGILIYRYGRKPEYQDLVLQAMKKRHDLLEQLKQLKENFEQQMEEWNKEMTQWEEECGSP